MKTREIELVGGGKLLYAKNTVCKTSLIEVNFGCGASVDTIPGLSHFVEHMFFTGTKTMTKDEVNKKYFDLMGTNASTSNDCIRFYARTLTKNLGEFLSTVATIINDSTFTTKALGKEKKVVCQEICRDRDHYSRFANLLNQYYLNHLEANKNGILGSVESVNSITSKDVKNYVQKYFVQNNVTIFVTSPLSLTKVKKLVLDNLYNRLKRNEKLEPQPLFPPDYDPKFFYKVKNVDIKKCYVYVNFIYDKPFKDLKFHEISLLLAMMNNYNQGVMKLLRLKKDLVYSAEFKKSYAENNSAIFFRTQCDKENVNEVIRTVAEYIEEKLKTGFDCAELEQEKKSVEYYEQDVEPRAARLQESLWDYLYHGKIIDEKKYMNDKRKVSVNDANKLFKEIFNDPKFSVFVYGGVKKKELMSEKELKDLFNFNQN